MTATTIIPANLKLGQQVNIESRTWPGINKPGGHATITKLHYDDDNTNNGVPTRIDVKYVLGGTEKQIEMTYVKPHVELARGGRSRRVDRKLTVDSFTSSSSSGGGRGGKENDGGGGVGKRGNKQNGNNKRKADGLPKKKKVVSKKSKGADDTAVVTAARIEEEEEKVVKDDDAAQKKTKNKSAPPKKTGKKNAASASAGASNKTKSIASYFASAGASASSATTKSTTATGASKSKSKAKESTKNTKKVSTSTTTTTVKPTKKTNPTTTKKSTTTTKSSSPKIKYSPNSILAVRAAHAKSPAKSHIFGTKTIGSLSGFAFPGSSGVQESLFPDEREEEQRRTFAAATAALNATSSSSSSTAAAAAAARPLRKKKETPTSSGKRDSSSTSLRKDKSAQNHKMMQSLYKNECVKAQEFVKSMVGSDTTKEEEDGSGTMSVNSSPESLELEMDSGRMNLFNKLLSEVMFRKGLDSMDVDEMISRINTSSQRDSATKPFTLLEVKAFLQELDSQNRIFVSWEEDNTGTIYSI